MAYNLPMQINLQAPTSDNIGKIKKSIETGLKHIEIGTPTKANIANIKKFVQSKSIGDVNLNLKLVQANIKAAKQALAASNIGNIKLTLSSPSGKNISDIKKIIQTKTSSIKVVLTPPSQSNLKNIRAAIKQGIGTFAVILTPPSATNLKKIKQAINSSGIGNVNVNITASGSSKANKQLNNLNQQMYQSTKIANTFFDTLEGKARSFAAYAIVSTAFLKLTSTISNATREALDYEKELINIAQTTDDSVSLTKDYASSLVEISKIYNITLTKAAQLTRIIAQTGLGFKESAQAAEILARTSLLAGFDSLTDTTEGFIAVLNTFNISVSRAGQVLESINILSKKYAVESGDLVEAIKRTGGAFSSAGGSIEELLALITAVRSTTRESAETISTGFRTIFARLQRPKTIEFFKQLGIQLETSEGQFIGPFQAIKAINDGLSRLNITVGSTDFAKVVEEIGGIRQISKVIPLLTQVGLAQEALDKSLEGKSQSFEDLQKAQQGLGYQLGVLQKQFSALIAEVVDSSGFKLLADVFINISKAVLDFVDTLKGSLPVLTAVGSLVAGRALGQILQGKGLSTAFGPDRAKERQKRRGFASGGFVPGSGSGDTVPAMLTPGEFVIRKSAVQAFGADRLNAINKYANGGKIGQKKQSAERKSTRLSEKAIAEEAKTKGYKLYSGSSGYSLEDSYGNSFPLLDLADARYYLDKSEYQKFAEGGVASNNKKSKTPSVNRVGEDLASEFNLVKGKNAWNQLESNCIEIARKAADKFGYESDFQKIKSTLDIFEKIRLGKTNKLGIQLTPELLAKSPMMRRLSQNPTSAKSSGNIVIREGEQLMKHVSFEHKNKEYNFGVAGKDWPIVLRIPLKRKGDQKFAKGGAVGTDTVPAMLTPGEFVINKKSAQAFGYGNLDKINRYAKGGKVTEQEYLARLDYRDVTGKAIDFSSGIDTQSISARKYAKALSGEDPLKVQALVETLRKEMEDAAKASGIALSKFGKSESWALWDVGKQIHMSKNPGESSSKYYLGNPLEDTRVQREIVQRHLGWEITGGQDVIGQRIASNELVNLGKPTYDKFLASKYSGPRGEDFSRREPLIKPSTIDIDKELKTIAKQIGGQVGSMVENLQVTIEDNLGGRGRAISSARSKSRSTTIQLNKGGVREATLPHEVGHAVDYHLGETGGNYASTKAGSFQNILAKYLRPKMAASMQAAGEDQKYTDYITRDVEIFAELFAKSNEHVRKILASTTDAEEGLKALAELLNKGKITRLYGGLESDLPQIIAEIKASSSAATTTPTASSPQPPMRNSKGRFIKAPPPVGLGRSTTSPPTPPPPPIYPVGGMGYPAQPPSKKPPKILAPPAPPSPPVGGLGYPSKPPVPVPPSPPKPPVGPIGGGLGYPPPPPSVPKPPKPPKPPITPPSGGGLGYPAPSPSAPFGGLGYPPMPPNTTKVTNANNSLLKSIEKLNVTYIEAAIYAQTFASFLSKIAGREVNQAALTSATVKGGIFSTAADSMAATSSKKNVFMLGKAIGQLPGPIGKLGTTLTKNAASIATAGKTLSRGLNAAAFFELFGGLADAIFSVDYEALKNEYIELGDATGAAAVAAKQYQQEQVRSIPIIGGLLSALGAGANATEDNIDANGQLVVATIKAAAQINKVGEEMLKLEKEFANANLEIDPIKRVQKQQEAVQSQLDLSQTLEDSQKEIQQKRQNITGASLTDSLSKGLIAGVGTAAGGAVLSGGTLAIPAAVLGVITGVGTAAYDYYSQLTRSTEDIIKSYEEESNLVKQASDIQTKLIDNFSNRLKAATVASVRAGGGYKEALDKITQEYGGQLNNVLGGFTLTGDLSVDIETITRKANDLKEAVDVLEKQKIAIPESDKEARAAKQTEIDKAKAQKDVAEKTRDAIQQTYYAEAAEKALAERRRIQTKAMEYQLQVMKQMESAYDGFNAALRNSRSIMEEISNIGTGKLSTRQVAGRYGINNDVFEMDAKEILRTSRGPNSVASQIAGFATRAGAPGQEIEKSLGRLDIIDAIGTMTKNKSLGDILKAEGESAGDPKEIQKIIYNQLAAQGYGVVEGIDPVLDEAVRVYAEKIAEGYENAGEAEESARQAATKQAEEIIAKQQEKFKEFFAAEQQLREYEIDLTNRRMELAKQSYDNEKAYFEERLALTNKVRDALTIEPTGQGRAGFVANRAAADRAAQMAGLNARRAQGFAGAGLGGANRSRAVREVSGDVQILGAMARAGLDVGTAFETLAGTTNMLISTIRDEIEIENQYLDGLIESAKAQQEYTQSLYDAQGAIVRDLVTGTNEDIGRQLTTLNAAAMAAQQGSFAGIPEDMKKDIFSLFDQFANVEIPGLGKTGREAQREITKNEMMRRFGVDAATAEQLASKAVQDRVPIDQRMAEQIENQKRIVEGLLAEEKIVKDAQLEKERITTELFAMKVNDFAKSVNEMLFRLNLPANPQAQLQAAPQPQQLPQNVVENARPENKPIQVVANGQQQITISLPDIQALVNQNITSMIFETVAQTFGNMADGVRTAQNFEDAATAIANASTQTKTQNMGGQV